MPSIIKTDAWYHHPADNNFSAALRHLVCLYRLFQHKVQNRRIPLVRGFDDEFYAPHSRHTTISREDIEQKEELMILAESEEATKNEVSEVPYLP